MGGAIDELFMCNIQDLELPLGFEVKADAFGLNVAYMTSEDQSLASTQALSVGDDGQTGDFYGNMNKLQMISFTNCKITRPLRKSSCSRICLASRLALTSAPRSLSRYRTRHRSKSPRFKSPSSKNRNG